MVSHGLNRCESLGLSHPRDRSLRIKQLTLHSAQTLIKDIYLLMTVDVMIVNVFKLLCDHGRWAIPLDKGLFDEILGGILRRLEAFVASPIGCGGSDIEITWMRPLFIGSEESINNTVWSQEANQNAGTKENIDAGDSPQEAESAQDYFVLPIWSSYTSTVKSSKASEEPTKHPDFQQVDKENQVFLGELERLKMQEQDATNAAEALRKEFAQETEDLLLQAGAAKASSTNIVNTASTPVSTASPYGGLSFTDLTNTDQDDSEIPALEEIYDNPTDGIFTNSSYDDEGAVADFTNLEPVVNVSPIPTSRINSIHPSTLILGDPQSAVQTRSKVTKSSGAHAFISERLEDESWVDAMQEELLQFKIQKVWILGHRQEEGIDYDEVFAPVSRIEAIRIFLAFASYMGFIVYQMDVKSVFLYGKIDEEVYVSQPLGFIDPKYPKKVYKVVKALYGLHQAPRACQDKYVAEILKKFDFVSVKTASTPIENQEAFVKDEEASDVDVFFVDSHMIGSFMYLSASRPDIMLQFVLVLGLVNPRLPLSVLRESLDSDYAGSNLDRKSTTGGCQFLSRRLISWQCKKQTIVATSTIEAEYVAAANCCGQNLVYHSKTKHIPWEHIIRELMLEWKLIHVLKIHTDDNVADLLTKAFDVSRFQFLVVTIGMINP
ncbi:putative ribonuclease H-like domain-containing protein [Tanacetum coccineum]